MKVKGEFSYKGFLHIQGSLFVLAVPRRCLWPIWNHAFVWCGVN